MSHPTTKLEAMRAYLAEPKDWFIAWRYPELRWQMTQVGGGVWVLSEEEARSLALFRRMPGGAS